MINRGFLALAAAAYLGLSGPAGAQSTVYIPAVLELSGAGAVSGTNFRDGMLLAIDEINAKGGILGRKIDTPILDTQSDAGISRAQLQKVLDNNPYVVLGPVFSGSVLVDMLLTQQAEIPEIVGGEVFTGGAGAAATTAVCAEPAEPEPAVLVAVTLTRTVEPTSAEVSV